MEKMKIPRNEPCPCLSGKKYKKCCDLQEKSLVNKLLSEVVTEVETTANKLDEAAYQELDQKFNAVVAAICKEDTAAAQLIVDELIANYPNDYNTNLLQGMVLVKQEKLPEAKAALEKAIRAYPLFAEAYYELGHVYFLQEDIRASISCLKKVLEIERVDAQNAELAQAAKEMLKSIEDSIKEACGLNLEEYVKMMTISERADNCFNSGKYKKAIALYKEVLQIDTKNADACRAIVLAYGHLGQEKLSKKYMDLLIELDPTLMDRFMQDYMKSLDNKEQQDESVHVLPEARIESELI